MADIVNCDADALVTASEQYCCIPKGVENRIMIYLLNEILGTGLTPDQLVENSKCYDCIPKGMQTEVMIYLVCSLVNASSP